MSWAIIQPMINTKLTRYLALLLSGLVLLLGAVGCGGDDAGSGGGGGDSTTEESTTTEG